MCTEEGKILKKEGVWFYALLGDPTWKTSKGRKSVLDYYANTVKCTTSSNAGICSCTGGGRHKCAQMRFRRNVGTGMDHAFCGLKGTTKSHPTGHPKYFKKYNLMVGHTTIPDGVPYKTQLDIDSLSIRIPYPNGSRQIRRSLQPILPMNTKLHEGSIVKNKYVQVVSTLIEMLNIYCPQEEEEVEGEHIMHSDVWRFDPISIMTI